MQVSLWICTVVYYFKTVVVSIKIADVTSSPTSNKDENATRPHLKGNGSYFCMELLNI